jgi:hypothetical protein
MIDRRSFIAAMPLALIACSSGAEESRASETASLPLMLVHKTPTCGCCNAWVDHLRSAGFTVETVDVPDTGPIANRLGVPNALRSCHTAEIGGYAIEGHVPAAEIRRLLTDRPDAAGLAVPDMPLGSPGMEMGDRRENYDVILFDRVGGTRIFASY